MARRSTQTKNKPNNGANLGFEQTLWQAADKLRGNMDAADYKHVVLLHSQVFATCLCRSQHDQRHP